MEPSTRFSDSFPQPSAHARYADGIRCTLMRGGTSKGPFFLRSDLPADDGSMLGIIDRVMGASDARCADGIGGTDVLGNKVAVVGASQRPDVDVDYLFIQVQPGGRGLDTSANCGNILAAVAPYAIEAGLVRATDPETRVRVFNVNTSTTVECRVQTPRGKVTYEGTSHIDGVPGSAAPVSLNFLDAPGAKTGALFPLGVSPVFIDGIAISCVDMTVPVLIARAADFGKTGRETPAELDADGALLARLEGIRRNAGVLLGFGDVSSMVIPKIALVSPPAYGGTLTSRYFTPGTCHVSHAVTGALAIGTCAMVPGTTAHAVAQVSPGSLQLLSVEHPSGRLQLELEVHPSQSGVIVTRAALVRTARRLFDGLVYPTNSLVT